MYATASLYRIASRRSASRGGSKRAERAKTIDKVSAAKNEATADIMADFVKSGTGGVPSNGGVERPPRSVSSATRAHNFSQRSRRAPRRLSRTAPTIVRGRHKPA